MNQANWTDILQSLGVIAALFFTGLEIRARTREQRFRNYLDGIAGFVQFARLMVEKPQLHALYQYSAKELNKTYEQLTVEEKARVHYCDSIIALCETVWLATEEGWLPKDEWLYWKRWAVDLNGSREFRWTLKWVANEYDEQFLDQMKSH